MPRNKSSKFAPYYAAIRYLESLNNSAGAVSQKNSARSYQKTDISGHPHPEMFLERMQDLLDLIGNPEKGFKYIHITGTSGKGSVSSIVHATLTAGGSAHGRKNSYRSGLFTSPFTVSTIEKIQVGKKYIDPLAFAGILDEIKPAIDRLALEGRHGMPSYFEIIFTIALKYFQLQKCRYVVLEVGLGGRYDATNIIRQPLITAITNIGLDHTAILGKTTAKIAFDKSGIIKNGSHFYTTESKPALLKIFQKACREAGAVYHACQVRSLDYAEKNRLLAASICIDLGIIDQPSEISVPESMPARFELVEKSPTVIIDSAHNPAKIASTVHNLRKLEHSELKHHRKHRRLSIVFAVSADKDWKAMLDTLLPLASSIYFTRFSFNGRQCLDPRILYEYAKKENCTNGPR